MYVEVLILHVYYTDTYWERQVEDTRLPPGEGGDEDCHGSWILWLSKKTLSFPLMEGYEFFFFFSPKTKRKLKFINEENNGIKAIWSKKTSVISIDVCLQE